MKKYALPAVRLLAPTCLLFIFSCTKSGNRHLQQEAAKLCAIRQFSFGVAIDRDTIAFSYDWLGRPVSSTRKFVGSGSPKYLFRYDDRGRLLDFIGAYDNGAAEFWTRYTYSEDNRTVWDSTYTLASEYTSWPPRPYFGDLITAIKQYDREGRVIQITTPIVPIVLPDTIITEGTQNYTYDAKGNLNGYTYDDKINYHRTNKVWMFIDDQYSVNNPFPIDAYDIYELPVKFNFHINPNPFPIYNPILFGLTYPDAVIEYDCGLPKGPVPAE